MLRRHSLSLVHQKRMRRFNKIPSYLCLLLVCLSGYLQAQPFQRFDYLPVSNGSNPLSFPWTGGWNDVQFGKADVNHDGIKDLVAYDKTNNKFCIFVAKAANSLNYRFESAYAAHFPPMSGWMILKDYNCDGIDDIFTYNGVGNLRVYTGYYDHDTLNFKLQQDGFFYYKTGNYFNVYCSDVIRPAIVDVNKDGDLDVISFNVTGNRLIYYENLQKESALGCDSLLFAKTDNCWGNVRDTLAAAYALRDTCTFKFSRIGITGQAEHTGSFIEAVDADNNGAVDVLIGSTTLGSITMLYNKGAPSYASILKQDVNYPGYNIPFNCLSFGSPCFVDADNDGKQDLLVSTFDVGASNINNVWYYRNTSSDSINLVLQSKNFLLDNMIDAGENSTPCIMDVDGDGLKDILIGNGGYRDNGAPAVYKLSYYKNTGAADYPEFTLQDADFLGISGLGVRDLSPAAGDLDNDQDTDLLVGIGDGRMLYWENTAGAGNPPQFVYRGILKDAGGNDISIGSNAAPCIIDLDRDGKKDLVIGEMNGNLNYYRGNATGSVSLSFVTDSLGKVRIKSAGNNLGYTQPCIADVNNDGKYDLILGTNLSGLQFYNNIEAHLNDSFALVSSIVDGLGLRTTSATADMTNDGKPELLTGSIDGGLIIFSQDPPPYRPTALLPHYPQSLDMSVFPNPADQQVFLQVADKFNDAGLVVFDILGNALLKQELRSGDGIRLDTHALANGVYFLHVRSGTKTGIEKIVIQHPY